jgi:prepilin-type N-terminal cleavage/methylation domain-containing protein
MKKFRAFTLIETLIVIIVFCIGILVVLYGLSQTLRNKDYANTQIKSAFFARE